MEEKHIYLCFDPGKYNIGFSILKDNGKLLHHDLLGIGISALNQSVRLKKEHNIFINELEPILEKISEKDYIYHVVFERFIPRMMQKGNIGETTNIFIGTILTLTTHKRMVYSLTAASWKNHRTKHNLFVENKTIPDHILDSIQMGHYVLLNNNEITIGQIKSRLRKIKRTNFGWKFINKEKRWIKI